jgi:Lar family restriction alleviation protein
VTSELKACPFCGSAADLVSHEDQRVTNYTYEVSCRGCGVRGEGADCGWNENSGSAKAEAVEIWNRRAPSPAVVRLVEACRDTLDWLELPGSAVEERAVALKVRDALAAVEKEMQS